MCKNEDGERCSEMCSFLRKPCHLYYVLPKADSFPNREPRGGNHVVWLYCNYDWQ